MISQVQKQSKNIWQTTHCNEERQFLLTVSLRQDHHHCQHSWEGQMVVQRLLKCGMAISREY